MRGAVKAPRITRGSQRRHPGDVASARGRGDNAEKMEKTNASDPARSRFPATWGPI